MIVMPSLDLYTRMGLDTYMSRQEVAEAMGISRQYVTKLEEQALNKLRLKCLAKRIKLEDLVRD